MKNHEKPTWYLVEVEVEVYLRQLGKVLIFRDTQTNRTFLLYIDLRSNEYQKNHEKLAIRWGVSHFDQPYHKNTAFYDSP